MKIIRLNPTWAVQVYEVGLTHKELKYDGVQDVCVLFDDSDIQLFPLLDIEKNQLIRAIDFILRENNKYFTGIDSKILRGIKHNLLRLRDNEDT